MLTAIPVKILNYALTLEHIENAFYKQGLANYSTDAFRSCGVSDRGKDGSFYDTLSIVAADEQAHVDFLTNALGDEAVAPCTYSFPSTDPLSFVALASVLVSSHSL